MRNEIRLTTGGREYAGWKSASVTRSIEAISGYFSIGLTERWPGQETVWPIMPEDECSISIGGETVITGDIDQIAPNFDSSSHDVSVQGRDRTGRMVDCSANHDPGEWLDIKLDRLAKKLAAPFGISVINQADVGKSFKFNLQMGETAFEALDRACRSRGVLPISDGQGNLILTKPGQSRCSTALVQGQNVKSANLTASVTERFGTYIVRGSQPFSDFLSSEQSTAVEARAIDAGVAASRTLIILPEFAVDIATARKRAQWEATVRAAWAVSVAVTVQGWRQGNGELWPVNGLVNVELPWLRVTGEMLISELTYSIDESGGTQTQMTLRRKDAFLPQPEMPAETDPLAALGADG